MTPQKPRRIVKRKLNMAKSLIITTFFRYGTMLTSLTVSHNFNQCAIPAFEMLLDTKNNEIVLDLLFELATWHALAKLRLHTESTVSELEHSTTRLGRVLCIFARSTCEDFVTVDLPSEEAARGRRKAAREPMSHRLS